MTRLLTIADRDTLHRRFIPSAILLFILLIFTANALGISYLSSSAALGISFNFTPLQLSPIVGSLEFNVMMTAGLLLSLLLPWLSPIQGSLLTLCCATVPVYVNYTHPSRQTLLPMEYVLLTILIIFAIDILIAWFEETRQKQRIVQLFGQYIPPQLAQTLTRRPDLVDLEGESKIMTVLFSDLQNFTGMSEQLNTKQLVRLLNDYLTAMSGVLYEYQSTIDKYIGDAIMSFWGAPLPQPDHATLAVRAALKMQEAMAAFSAEYGKRGWPQMKMGIGINTGRMSVGNMGSKYRLAYTVMGDAVNLASRLEGLTRVYRVPVIVGEATMREAGGIVYRELDTVQVRGKHKSCRIFQPLCAEAEQSGDFKERLALHQRAIDAWYKGDLLEAQAIFGRLAKLDPDDGYYTVMLGRIAEKMN
jgi:adenylate cyclase